MFLFYTTAIQLARLSGFSPIITTASLHNTDFVKSRGATHVLDRKLPQNELIPRINEIASGVPIEYIYDTVSAADSADVAIEVLAPGGVLVGFRTLPALIPENKRQGKTVAHEVYGSFHTPSNRKLGVQLYSKLTELLENGTLLVCSLCSIGLSVGYIDYLLRA